MPKQKRRHSTTHAGVSIKDAGNGRHRLRWREVDPDGRTVAQSWTVSGTAQDAERAAIAVFEALQTAGTFVRPEAVDNRKRRPEVADLRGVLAGWAEWRKEMRGDRPRTVELRTGILLRAEDHVRVIHGLEEDTPIPVTLLDRATCQEIAKRIEGPHAKSTLLAALWGAWTWATDDLDAWPGLKPAPRNRALVVPDLPPPGRPLDPPEWKEVMTILDCAALTRGRTFDAFAIGAYTGLRFGQVVRLLAGDFDLDTDTLTIRGDLGKSRQERSGRLVPIAPALRPVLFRLLQGLEPEDRIITPKPQHITLSGVMEAAEARGVRASVWRAPQRGNKRPSHWARAGFQHFMRQQGVAENVIDNLVGHKAKTTRDKSYVPVTADAMAAAVEQLPDLPPELVGGEVVSLRRA